MAKLRIVPYKRASDSARLLAQALAPKLGYKVFRGEPKGRGFVNLHWGTATHNKIAAFTLFERENVPHVPFTTEVAVAQRWLREGRTVFARTAGGQAGSGITIVTPDNGELPNKPLYTQYVKKRKEFRVHVFAGQVIDVQEKRRRNGAERGSLIRNLENGWVFCHENIVEPTGLRDAAIRACAAVGYLFGGVDLIWNERNNQIYVLEVNSAPGLCPTTAEKYANAIQAHFPTITR